MIKVNYKKDQNNVNNVLLVFLLLTLNIFHTFFYCFYCYLEQVNISWNHILITHSSLVKGFSLLLAGLEFHLRKTIFQFKFLRSLVVTLMNQQKNTRLRSSLVLFRCVYYQPIGCQCTLSLLPENIRFSDVFRGQRKCALGKNGLTSGEDSSIFIVDFINLFPT